MRNASVTPPRPTHKTSSASSSPASSAAATASPSTVFGAPNMSIADPNSGDSVVVAIRVRPLSEKEQQTAPEPIVSMSSRRRAVYVDGEAAGFACDYPLWSHHAQKPDKDGAKSLTQEDVFNTIGKPLLENALEGYNAAVLAFGQTGSGKTYTMMGDVESATDSIVPETAGLLPRICTELFARCAEIHEQSNNEIKWTVQASFVEVYLEQTTDLLRGMKDATAHATAASAHAPSSTAVREDAEGNFIVVGANKVPVKNLSEVLNTVKYGNRLRRTAATDMNAHSSRSHALFFLHLTETLTITMPDGTNASAHSKSVVLKLVDLAGSERVSESGVTGDRFKEAVNINKSLHTLGNVIDALTDPKRKAASANGVGHIPYRNSILTKLLKQTFGGNSKTILIATVGPSEAYRSQTVHTLGYATRARRIQNMAVVMEDPQAFELRNKQAELDRVRRELAEAQEQLQAGAVDNERTRELERQLQESQSRIKADQEDARQRDLIIERKQQELEALVASSANQESRLAALEKAKLATAQELLDTEQSLKEAQENADKAAAVLKEKEEMLKRQLAEVDAAAARRLRELEDATKAREEELQRSADESEKRAAAREESIRAKADAAEAAALRRERDLAAKADAAEREAAAKQRELADKARAAEEKAHERERELADKSRQMAAEAREREAELVERAAAATQKARARELELEEEAAAAARVAAQKQSELHEKMAAAEARAREQEREMQRAAEEELKKREAALQDRLAVLEATAAERLAQLQSQTGDRERELQAAAADAERAAKEREKALQEKAEGAERLAKTREADLSARVAAASVAQAEAKKRELELMARAREAEENARRRDEHMARLSEEESAREAKFKAEEKKYKDKMAADRSTFEAQLRRLEDEMRAAAEETSRKRAELAKREEAFQKQLEAQRAEQAEKERQLQDRHADLDKKRLSGVGNARTLTDELLDRIAALQAENEMLRRGVKNCAKCTFENPAGANVCSVCQTPFA